MDRGKRHLVSVRQLRIYFNDPSIQATKEGSYRWANRWWIETSQSSQSSQSSSHPLVEINGIQIDSPMLADAVLALAYHDRGIPLPNDLTDAIIGKHRRQELDRGFEALLHPVEVPLERTVGNLVNRYIDMLLTRHRAYEISVGEYSNARSGLCYFRDWLGPGTTVDIIDSNRWDDYYLHLISDDAPKSIESRRKHFRYARNFLVWMDDLNILPCPKNLNRKQYRFKGGSRSVPTLATEVVKDTVGAARGQLKLHLLLMLNCGFTQQDIADLHPSEIDWTHGRIHRKRSKTSSHANVPTIDYVLWSETFSLLKKYKSNDSTHALMTESGKAWMRDEIHGDGSRSRTDAIQSIYRKLDVKDKPSLKMFRKASSTLLNGSPDHGKYAIHFLGHAPSDVARKHYISENGPSFDAAIRWLGEQFGY